MAENKWVPGVITPIYGVITLLTTGRGPPCMEAFTSIEFYDPFDVAKTLSLTQPKANLKKHFGRYIYLS